MKHNYSNADIRRATVYAGLDIHAADIRLILDALPEPATDDCQEAPFIPVADAQKGDRVRIDTWQDAHEVTVTEVDPVTIYWEHGHTPKKYVTSVRLLDRPFQHPDPEQHPYVFDDEGDLWAWSENRQVYVEPNTGVTGPADGFIEGWTPADVVPKVVEDDR